jgi:hypothetical protein
LGVPCKNLHTKTNASDGQQNNPHFTKSIGFAPKQIGTVVRFGMGESQDHIALQLALPDILLLNKDVHDVEVVEWSLVCINILKSIRYMNQRRSYFKEEKPGYRNLNVPLEIEGWKFLENTVQ